MSADRNYAYADITGQKFGRLTALRRTGTSDAHGSVMWHCLCDCGNEVDVSYNSLVYTNMQSCGCQKKEHNQKLRTFLTHVGGTSVEMLKSKKVPSDNTTGYKGVYLIRGKYVAKIVFQKKAYYLGTYDTMEEAVRARQKAEVILFDEVAQYCEKWKELAARDPKWGEENPVQIIVKRTRGEDLSVTCLPPI